MKNVIKILSVFAIVSIFFTSCSRDDNNNGNNNNPPATSGFKWRENDPNGTDKIAASSELRATYKSIFAFDASGTTLFEINLTGAAPGTYDLSASGNSFYFKDMATGSAIWGEVVITTNAGGKASGTFKALTGGSGITRVYGTFTDIPVN